MSSKKINSELKKKSAADLGTEAARLKKELFDIEFKHATRQLADLMSIRKTRRDLARALTFKTQAEHAPKK